MGNSNNDTISILELADTYSAANPLFSTKKRKCRQAFLDFMDANNCFGAQRAYSPLHINRNDAEQIRPKIELWISSYASTDDKKLELLTERLLALFPKTGELFAKFIDYAQPKSSVAWKLADYLCFALKDEIAHIESNELDCLAEDMDNDLPLFSARLFSEFLVYARERGVLSNGWMYQFNSRSGAEMNDDAYETADFLKMAYAIFNEESWENEQLLKKALQSERDANLWLFVSCHFICAWRGTDIVRLPMPTLPADGYYIREQISAGDFDATGILNELEFRLRYTPLTPQKTERYGDVPELKFFVPESFGRPFGIIYAIAASHHESKKPGESFMRRAGDKAHILAFFGEGFAKACGVRGFSSRRAVKSYLQGIETMADSSTGRPKGYMLAALARSHKGGIGSLPKTTDVYLRDAKFSGYRPEFIAREMFERGVFSFIPSMMMEMYVNDTYTDLPIDVQTKLLAEIGIEAPGLEGLARAVDRSLAKARLAVADIMKHPEDIRGSISDILQNIASGNAPGKQDGFLCLMTASGFTCADALRSCCIGCGYEIYTKTILHNLSKECARLQNMKGSASPMEAARYRKIQKEAVMPAISEIYLSIKRMYPGADIKALVKTAKMGAMLC